MIQIHPRKRVAVGVECLGVDLNPSNLFFRFGEAVGCPYVVGRENYPFDGDQAMLKRPYVYYRHSCLQFYIMYKHIQKISYVAGMLHTPHTFSF